MIGASMIQFRRNLDAKFIHLIQGKANAFCVYS